MNGEEQKQVYRRRILDDVNAGTGLVRSSVVTSCLKWRLSPGHRSSSLLQVNRNSDVQPFTAGTLGTVNAACLSCRVKN